MRTELCFANSYLEARRKFYDACARAGVTPVAYENPNGLTLDGQLLVGDVAQCRHALGQVSVSVPQTLEWQTYCARQGSQHPECCPVCGQRLSEACA